MDLDGQPGLAPHPTTSYSYAEYAPPPIEPCATFIDESGAKVPGLFHLISCGHLVAVVESDRRCGRNCQHALGLINTQTVASDGENILRTHSDHLPPATTTQAIDQLYCETCNGIPVDRYKMMNPHEGSSQIRRSVALTRTVLQGALMLPEDQVDAILCAPAFRADQETCSEHIFHKLRCGHLVWSTSPRSCASNCIDSVDGGTTPSSGGDRQSDAIMCRECVTRAEVIIQRYARLHASMASGTASRYGKIE